MAHLGVIPAVDALLAMPHCAYTHIKDVRVTDDGYFFTPLGHGDIDCAAILRALAATDLVLAREQKLHALDIAHGRIDPTRMTLGDDGPVLTDFSSAKVGASKMQDAGSVTMSEETIGSSV